MWLIYLGRSRWSPIIVGEPLTCVSVVAGCLCCFFSASLTIVHVIVEVRDKCEVLTVSKSMGTP